ncbi:MAG: hypothetical protein IKE36_03865 [Solobacterium sp.]|nr:hypothetical protein [Solobacterium sp.]
MSSISNDNETIFKSWLSSNAPPIQLPELYLAYKEIESQAKKVNLVKASLYEDLDISIVKRIRSEIEQDRIFKFTHTFVLTDITYELCDSK